MSYTSSILWNDQNICLLIHCGWQPQTGWIDLGQQSAFAQIILVMAWCHQATSHYLNMCWLINKDVLLPTPESNFLLMNLIFNMCSEVEPMAHVAMGHFFSTCYFFQEKSNIVHYECNILVCNCRSNALNIFSVLWILMAFCFSTKALADAMVSTHPLISSCLGLTIIFSFDSSNII